MICGLGEGKLLFAEFFWTKQFTITCENVIMNNQNRKDITCQIILITKLIPNA